MQSTDKKQAFVVKHGVGRRKDQRDGPGGLSQAGSLGDGEKGSAGFGGRGLKAPVRGVPELWGEKMEENDPGNRGEGRGPESEEVRRMREEVEMLEMQVGDMQGLLERQKMINIGVGKELEKFIFGDSKLRRELCDTIRNNENILEDINDKRRAFVQNTRKQELKKKELEALRKNAIIQRARIEKLDRLA